MTEDGTSTASGRWIRKDYPEPETEPMNLIPEESYVLRKEKIGLR